MSDDFENLKELIRLNFSKDNVPSKNEICFSMKYHSLDSDEQDVIDYFLGKSWDKFETKCLIENYWMLSFLSSKSFKYYLPAFLISGLVEIKKSQELRFGIVCSFVESEDEEINNMLRDRINEFNYKQIVILVEYFEAMNRINDIDEEWIADAIQILKAKNKKGNR